MRVLLIKTSSMGDLIHTFPALTDAGKAIADIQFDWVVEDSFKQIPSWHPLVHRVIPVALRRWRKGIFSKVTRAEWKQWRNELQSTQYDLVLDAQGLVKSAFLSLFANGLRAGLDVRSAREAFASFAYQKKCKVNFYQHAIVRMRHLFSEALGYALPLTSPEFGLSRESLQLQTLSGHDPLITHDVFYQTVPATHHQDQPYLVFLHGTTWTTKLWPEAYWIELANMAAKAGYQIKVGGGNAAEVERAERIANACRAVKLLPRLDILGMAQVLANAKAVVAVDTGLGHLAAALDVPTLSIYGSTNPAYTGALGQSSIHITADFACAPCLSRTCRYREATTVEPACYAAITPARVWERMQTQAWVKAKE